MPTDLQEYEFLVIGESQTGKTSLIHRLSSYPLTSAPVTTLGIHSSFLYLDSTKRTKIAFTDTGGLNRVQPDIFPFVEKAHVILLVYDTTREETFQAASWWLHFWHGPESSYREKLIFLIGSVDQPLGREVTYEEGVHLAEEFGTCFVEMQIVTEKPAHALLLCMLNIAKSFHREKPKRRFWQHLI